MSRQEACETYVDGLEDYRVATILRYRYILGWTCATTALNHGMSIELVSKMLGHESLDTTMIYLDLTDEDLKNAHRKYVN